MTRMPDPPRLAQSGILSGQTLVAQINAFVDALATLQSAPTPPASPADGAVWLDTTTRDAATLKIYDAQGARWTAALRVNLDTQSPDALPVAPLAAGGTGAADAPTARANLGLGALATLAQADASHIADGAVGARYAAIPAFGVGSYAIGMVGGDADQHNAAPLAPGSTHPASRLVGSAVGADRLVGAPAAGTWRVVARWRGAGANPHSSVPFVHLCVRVA